MSARVGIDATGWVNKRGYGRFARNAVRSLVARDPDTTYVLYIDEESADEAEFPDGVETRRVPLRRAPARAASADSSRPVGDVLRLSRAVRRDRLDAFVFPSLQTYFPVLGTPTIVGLHDAIADELPHLTMPTRRARALWRLKQNLAVRGATRVFTVSEAARAALAEQLGLEPERVGIVPEAPDPLFSPRGADEVERAREEVGVPRRARYFLYAGGISPHKNIETLLEAYGALPSRVNNRPLLVLVGELESETYVSAAGAVREAIARLGLEDFVLLPGFVSDETLAALYTGSLAVVNASLAEGFGLPAVEAGACGATLVLSDLPAHRETMDGAALFFPPRDTASLTAALTRVADDDGLRRALGSAASHAAAELTWDAAGDRLRQLIVEAARPSVREAYV